MHKEELHCEDEKKGKRGGGMAYSKDLREAALRHYDESEDSIRSTAEVFGVSSYTFRRWLEASRRGEEQVYGTSPGRTRKLSEEGEERLVKLVEEHPDWTQEMFAQALNEEFELELNQPNISRALARLGITLKKRNSEQTKRGKSASKS